MGIRKIQIIYNESGSIKHTAYFKTDENHPHGMGYGYTDASCTTYYTVNANYIEYINNWHVGALNTFDMYESTFAYHYGVDKVKIGDNYYYSAIQKDGYGYFNFYELDYVRTVYSRNFMDTRMWYLLSGTRDDYFNVGDIVWYCNKGTVSVKEIFYPNTINNIYQKHGEIIGAGNCGIIDPTYVLPLDSTVFNSILVCEPSIYEIRWSNGTVENVSEKYLFKQHNLGTASLQNFLLNNTFFQLGETVGYTLFDEPFTVDAVGSITEVFAENKTYRVNGLILPEWRLYHRYVLS